MKNSFKSLKFIYSLARFNPEDYPQVNTIDDYYIGIDGNKIPLKILSRFNKNDKSTIIMFPGASPDAEKHQGMLFLGSIICKLGYRVIIPRIPPLKILGQELKGVETTIDATKSSQFISSLLMTRINLSIKVFEDI